MAAQLWSQGAAQGHDGAVSALAGAIAPPAQREGAAAFLDDWSRNAAVSGLDGDSDWQRVDAVGRIAGRLAAGRQRRAELLAAVDVSALRPKGASYLRSLAALDAAWADYAALRQQWLSAQGRRAGAGRWAQAAAADDDALARAVLRGMGALGAGAAAGLGRMGRGGGAAGLAVDAPTRAMAAGRRHVAPALRPL